MAKKAKTVYRVTSIVVISFICYVFILFLFFFFFSTKQALVVTLTLLTLSCSAAQTTLNVVFCPSDTWRSWIGRMSAGASLAAIVVGLFVHYSFLVFYNHYESMQTVTNVAASENALQFDGAGTLIFSADTVVDVQRSVGYRDANTSTTLCVAPVVDSTMTTEDPVGFFAVGTGCCGWRGSFTCDDVADSSAKGGMLLLEPRMLVSPLASWTVDRAVDFEAYDAAIKLESAVFGTTVAKNTRILRWLKDVPKEAEKYKQHAMLFALISCVLELIVSTLMAFVILDSPFSSRNTEKFAIV